MRCDSFPKKDEAGGTAKWVYALLVIPMIVAVIAWIVKIYPDKEQVGQNKAAVTESTFSLKATQEAAERGDAGAQFDLVWMYAEGKGVLKNSVIISTEYRPLLSSCEVSQGIQHIIESKYVSTG